MRLMLGLLWLLHWLPLPILGRLGEWTGSSLFLCLHKRRHVALTNLKLCLPHLSAQERHALARRHFQLYARSVFERAVLWRAPHARLRKLMHITPGVPLQQINSRPTILLCPHFVCLDVAGAAVAMHVSGCSMYTAQSNPLLDAALKKGRMRFHPPLLVTRTEGIRPILRAMRAGMPFFMLPDMDFGEKNSVFVPFFGVPSATLTAPARLARISGAQVIPVVATFLPDYRGWEIRFYPPLENFPGDDLQEATQRLNHWIEQRVLENPAEYFWAHRRFKTRPPGEPSVYDREPS